METPPQGTIARRRSDRLPIAFPVVASGIDPSGKRFRVKTKTTAVSLYGCSLPLPRLLQPDQEIPYAESAPKNRP